MTMYLNRSAKQADVLAAKAAVLEMATLNLGYATVTAPIFRTYWRGQGHRRRPGWPSEATHARDDPAIRS